MIFGQDMIDLIVAGEKTQTRRRSGRYGVGRIYSVQPGRGQKGVASIQIVERRLQRLREITTLDAIAEGFSCRQRFFDRWAAMTGGVDFDQLVYAYRFRRVG